MAGGRSDFHNGVRPEQGTTMSKINLLLVRV